MSGFQKAKAEQAALKIAMYGLAGSGKTFSALLIAEGIAAQIDKRVAVIDTEHGTDFYVKRVPGRKVHPEAFDIDALYTRSLREALDALRGLSAKTHGVVVLDSITHLWETAIASYTGKKTKIGSIPMHAWGPIKKPYKDLMQFLLNSPFHVFICGRQGNEFEEDDSGEIKSTGVKMKAEKETPYEPHICIHMQRVKAGKHDLLGTPTAFVEKDRSGVLQGASIEFPDFAKVAAPLLGLLGETQAQLPDDDAAALADARGNSAQLLREQQQRFSAAATLEALEEAVGALPEDHKERMLPADLNALRAAYAGRRTRIQEEQRLKKAATPESKTEPPTSDANGSAAPAKKTWVQLLDEKIAEREAAGYATARDVKNHLKDKIPNKGPMESWDDKTWNELAGPLVKGYWLFLEQRDGKQIDTADQDIIEEKMEQQLRTLQDVARAANVILGVRESVGQLSIREGYLFRRELDKRSPAPAGVN